MNVLQPLSGASVHWKLWSNDYFDRESSPFLEREGEGLVAGCRALWEKTLEEGILDDGRPTFTGFVLHTEQGERSLPRDPFCNKALARLRQWRDFPDLIEALAVSLATSPAQTDELLQSAMTAATADELREQLQSKLPGSSSVMQTPEEGCLCEVCGTRTVVFLRNDPPGFQLFRCTSCGEIKRWCPWCGQGWLIHFVVGEDPHSRYACDDCGTVWNSQWMKLTSEDKPYHIDEVMGSNPVHLRDFERS